MRNVAFVLVAAAMLPVTHAKATVLPSFEECVAAAQWIVVARVASFEDTSDAHRYRVLLEVKHVLKGRPLSEQEGNPGHIHFFHYDPIPPEEGFNFRDDSWQSTDYICYLRRNHQTKEVELLGEYVGAYEITPRLLDKLSRNGIDVRAVTASDVTFFSAVVVLIFVVATTAIITSSIIWQTRLGRRSTQQTAKVAQQRY